MSPGRLLPTLALPLLLGATPHGSGQEMGPPAPGRGESGKGSVVVDDYDEPPEPIWTGMPKGWFRPKSTPKKVTEENVVLEAVIAASGRVESVRIIKSVPFFDDIAIDWVKSWKFKAAQKDGQPVAARKQFSVRFDSAGAFVEDKGSLVPVTPEGRPEPRKPAAQGAEPQRPPVAQEEPPLSPPLAAEPRPSASVVGPTPLVLALAYDGRELDFSAWEERFKTEVGKSWKSPELERGGACDSVFEVVFERDGSVSGVKIVKRSGNPAFDKAVFRSLFECVVPLPAQYPAPRMTSDVTFSCSTGEPEPPR